VLALDEAYSLPRIARRLCRSHVESRSNLAE
jgi:hypothetical protein